VQKGNGTNAAHATEHEEKRGKKPAPVSGKQNIGRILFELSGGGEPGPGVVENKRPSANRAFLSTTTRLKKTGPESTETYNLNTRTRPPSKPQAVGAETGDPSPQGGEGGDEGNPQHPHRPLRTTGTLLLPKPLLKKFNKLAGSLISILTGKFKSQLSSLSVPQGS